MARKKPIAPARRSGPVPPPCMVEGCPGVSHLHGLCAEHWERPVPLLLWAVAPVDTDGGYWAGPDAQAPGWELAMWRSGGNPARPDRVELFDSEDQARAAAERYA